MLPQVIENYQQGRVKGLSHLLVFLNNIGDLMKLAYFFLNVTFSITQGSTKTIYCLRVYPSRPRYHSYCTDHLLQTNQQG